MDYMKISQDTTNELWSVILRRTYKTPGEKKRAIERQVRAALEAALGLPSTVDGWVGGREPFFGTPCREPTHNPYSTQEKS